MYKRPHNSFRYLLKMKILGSQSRFTKLQFLEVEFRSLHNPSDEKQQWSLKPITFSIWLTPIPMLEAHIFLVLDAPYNQKASCLCHLCVFVHVICSLCNVHFIYPSKHTQIPPHHAFPECVSLLLICHWTLNLKYKISWRSK